MVLRNAKKLLGNSFPNLLLFDSLYFNKPHFDLVRKGLDAHLLIKSSDPSFREVLKDADFFFQNKDLVDVPITVQIFPQSRSRYILEKFLSSDKENFHTLKSKSLNDFLKISVRSIFLMIFGSLGII